MAAVAHSRAAAVGARATRRVRMAGTPRSRAAPRSVARAYATVNLPKPSGPRIRAATIRNPIDRSRVAWLPVLKSALRAMCSAGPAGGGEARVAESHPEPGVGQEGGEGLRQGLGGGLDEEGRAAGDLGEGPPARRDHRRAGGHRFEHGKAEPL